MFGTRFVYSDLRFESFSEGTRLGFVLQAPSYASTKHTATASQVVLSLAQTLKHIIIIIWRQGKGESQQCICGKPFISHYLLAATDKLPVSVCTERIRIIIIYAIHPYNIHKYASIMLLFIIIISIINIYLQCVLIFFRKRKHLRFPRNHDKTNGCMLATLWYAGSRHIVFLQILSVGILRYLYLYSFIWV